MGIRELLVELSEASGVSGHEEPVRRVVVREMEKYADDVFVTRLGSVVGIRYADGKRSGPRVPRKRPDTPKLMLEGHMDEIGLVVTSVDKGFIRFTQIGGYDVRVLPSQNVLVHSREEIPGVIGSRPPHVLNQRERGSATPMPDLFIDVGLPETRVKELVTVGDVITLDRKVTALRNDYLAGKGFDDRAAVAVVIDVLRTLRNSQVHWDVYAVANVQEEDGAWYVGASTSAFRIQPDAALALDVSHADQPGIGEVNILPLDKGPGIAIGPNIHPIVHSKLVEVARSNEIPHRITTYAGSTGTDAWAIQIVADGIPTGLIDLPLRYMHTSVETLALDDLERASRLSASFAAALDDQFFHDIKGEPIVKVERTVRTPRRPRKKRRK
jgi:putative aminopeptidase FrvX